MSKSRASIFGEDDTTTLDVTAFAPKPEVDRGAPSAVRVKEVSQAANFQSREPVAAKAPAAKPAKRAVRQYRTGRNVPLSLKASRETVETLYEITDKQGWVLGYTLQRAMEALQRELKKPQ